jgi:hypothetical protein
MQGTFIAGNRVGRQLCKAKMNSSPRRCAAHGLRNLADSTCFSSMPVLSARAVVALTASLQIRSALLLLRLRQASSAYTPFFFFGMCGCGSVNPAGLCTPFAPLSVAAYLLHACEPSAAAAKSMIGILHCFMRRRVPAPRSNTSVCARIRASAGAETQQPMASYSSRQCFASRTPSARWISTPASWA